MKSGWVTKKLGEVCEESIRRLKDIDDSRFLYIDISSIDRVHKTIVGTTEYKRSEAPGRAQQVVEVDDVLVSTVRPNLNAVAIVGAESRMRRIASTGFCVLRAKEGVDPKFIYYFTNTNQFVAPLVAVSEKAAYPSVTDKIVKNVDIPIPPLAEQKRIVAKIDAAFEKIDKLKANAEKNLANAKELFQTALDEAMHPKKGWIEKRLPDISLNKDSKRVPITKSQRESGSVPYYGASGIVDYVKDYIFDGEYLLVSEDGANLESRTYPIAFSITGKSWVNNHAHILEFKNADVQAYVELYLNAISLKDFITGTAQPKLTQENLNKIPIHLPGDHAKLSEIVNQLRLIRIKLETLQQNYAQQIADCAEMRQAILREAFEGKI